MTLATFRDVDGRAVLLNSEHVVLVECAKTPPGTWVTTNDGKTICVGASIMDVLKAFLPPGAPSHFRCSCPRCVVPGYFGTTYS